MTSLIGVTHVDTNQIIPFMPSDLLSLAKRSQDILVTHRLTESIVSINYGSYSFARPHLPFSNVSIVSISLGFKHDDDLDRQMTSICPSLTATTRLSELNMLHTLPCQVFLG